MVTNLLTSNSKKVVQLEMSAETLDFLVKMTEKLRTIKLNRGIPKPVSSTTKAEVVFNALIDYNKKLDQALEDDRIDVVPANDCC